MKHILVVDDEPQILSLLKITLERAGYGVTTAGDGTEAARLYDPATCDLVITDIVMPDKEGIETIMELRAVNPGVPIIAISGGGRIDPEDYLDWARRFGVNRTFAKPLDRAELLEAVAELLAEVPA
jgi:DNA-binding response OmpR family regulator